MNDYSENLSVTEWLTNLTSKDPGYEIDLTLKKEYLTLTTIVKFIHN